MDDVEKRKFLTLPGLELRPLDRPARSQSQYRLLYPGSCSEIIIPTYTMEMFVKTQKPKGKDSTVLTGRKINEPKIWA
jgi:hypothetical protein